MSIKKKLKKKENEYRCFNKTPVLALIRFLIKFVIEYFIIHDFKSMLSSVLPNLLELQKRNTSRKWRGLFLCFILSTGEKKKSYIVRIYTVIAVVSRQSTWHTQGHSQIIRTIKMIRFFSKPQGTTWNRLQPLQARKTERHFCQRIKQTAFGHFESDPQGPFFQGGLPPNFPFVLCVLVTALQGNQTRLDFANFFTGIEGVCLHGTEELFIRVMIQHVIPHHAQKNIFNLLREKVRRLLLIFLIMLWIHVE